MLLKSERLNIRYVKESDWQSIREIWKSFNASAYAQYDKPHSTDDADVRKRIANWVKFNGSLHMFFAVCIDNTVIGYVTFNAREENTYELSYCFHSDYHGKGYASESILMLFRYLFNMGITEISAGTALNNLPSVKLLKSLGFNLIDTEKVSFYKNSDGNDIIFDGGIFRLSLDKDYIDRIPEYSLGLKIAVIGYSGSGKSTLAAWLGEKMSLPVLHLDCVYWLPGWNKNGLDEQLEIVREFILKNDNWVIDGNYSKLDYWERMKSADRIIFMDFGRLNCLLRAYRRHRKYKGKTRASITQGCDEKFDREFILWILRDGRSKATKKRYAQVCCQFKDKVTVIKNQRQLDHFIESFESQYIT